MILQFSLLPQDYTIISLTMNRVVLSCFKPPKKVHLQTGNHKQRSELVNDALIVGGLTQVESNVCPI